MGNENKMGEVNNKTEYFGDEINSSPLKKKCFHFQTFLQDQIPKSKGCLFYIINSKSSSQ